MKVWSFMGNRETPTSIVIKVVRDEIICQAARFARQCTCPLCPAWSILVRISVHNAAYGSDLCAEVMSHGVKSSREHFFCQAVAQSAHSNCSGMGPPPWSALIGFHIAHVIHVCVVERALFSTYWNVFYGQMQNTQSGIIHMVAHNPLAKVKKKHAILVSDAPPSPHVGNVSRWWQVLCYSCHQQFEELEYW